MVSVVSDQPDLASLVGQINTVTPVAIDAERAQSFRYSARAYLIQLRQADCGTTLLDPVALAGPDGATDLHALGDALTGCEWVLHAATQDLPCLAEVGMRPQRLFDTELAGRLLGLPRVSLSAMLTHYFGIELAKLHSADDWSRRPLPDTWLDYAALDVDYLLDLRDAVADDLADAGKDDWARQEFDDIMARFAELIVSPEDRWRHTKGLSRLHDPRQLAIAHNLWLVRDELACRLDIFPGRILPDVSLVDATVALCRLKPADVPDVILTLNGFTGPLARRQRRRWASAVQNALQDDQSDLPQAQPSRGTPPPRAWNQLRPRAAKRWMTARPVIVEVAEQNSLPPENLMTVSTLADVLWPDHADYSEDGLRITMAQAHARPWQVDLAAPAIAAALAGKSVHL